MADSNSPRLVRSIANIRVLHVTEYSNLGDTTRETPVEPPICARQVQIGAEAQSLQLKPETCMVSLLATERCFVSFADGAWVPLAAESEVLRAVRPGTGARIAVTERPKWTEVIEKPAETPAEKPVQEKSKLDAFLRGITQ